MSGVLRLDDLLREDPQDDTIRLDDLLGPVEAAAPKKKRLGAQPAVQRRQDPIGAKDAGADFTPRSVTAGARFAKDAVAGMLNPFFKATEMNLPRTDEGIGAVLRPDSQRPFAAYDAETDQLANAAAETARRSQTGEYREDAAEDAAKQIRTHRTLTKYMTPAQVAVTLAWGPVESKIATALTERLGAEKAAEIVSRYGVERAAGWLGKAPVAKAIGAHAAASAVTGAAAMPVLDPEHPVQAAAAGAVMGPAFRVFAAAVKGAYRGLTDGTEKRLQQDFLNIIESHPEWVSDEAITQNEIGRRVVQEFTAGKTEVQPRRATAKTRVDDTDTRPQPAAPKRLGASRYEEDVAAELDARDAANTERADAAWWAGQVPPQSPIITPPPAGTGSPFRDAMTQKGQEALDSYERGEPLLPQGVDNGRLDAQEATNGQAEKPSDAGMGQGGSGAAGEGNPGGVRSEVVPDGEGGRGRGEAVATKTAEDTKLDLSARPAVNGPSGHDGEVFLSTGARVKTQYRVVEADDLQQSHDPFTFSPNPQYPAGVQGREYSGSRGEAARQQVQTGALRPEVVLDTGSGTTDGPPVITPHGIVFVGNDRTMRIKRSAELDDDSYGRYRSELMNRAAQFGVDPNEVAGMKRPVLVRQITDPSIDVNDPRALATFNRDSDTAPTKTKDQVTAAMSRAKAMQGATGAMQHLADSLDPESTIRDYLGENDGREFVRQLVSDGVIQRQELPAFIDSATNAVTSQGKTLIEDILHAAAIGDADVMSRAPANIMRKLGSSIPAIIHANQSGAYSLERPLQEALNIHASAAAMRSDIGSGKRSVADFLSQGDMFGRNINPHSAGLALFLERSSPTTVAQVMRTYAKAAAEGQSAASSHDIFGFQPEAPEKLQSRLFGGASGEGEGSSLAVRERGPKDKWEERTADLNRRTDSPVQTWDFGSYSVRLFNVLHGTAGDIKLIATDPNGTVIADLFAGDINGKVEASVEVHPQWRRKGIATALYKLAERVKGKSLTPSLPHSPDAEAFWKQPNRPFGKPAERESGSVVRERGTDLWGNKAPEDEGDLFGDADIGKAPPPKPIPGGYAVKAEAAKKEADFLRKQLARITDPTARGKIASRTADLDRIAKFGEAITAPEMEVRLASNAKYESPSDADDTLPLFERASRNTEQLELTFGSLDAARKAAEDLIAESGDYVMTSDMPILTPEARKANLERSDKIATAQVDIRGKKMHSVEDLFRLLHPFRSPRYEKMHVVYLQDDGTIVAHRAITSGVLNYVSKNPKDFADEVATTARQLGVSKVAKAHNHPSGISISSTDDLVYARNFGYELQARGIYQIGHLVIDHDTATWLQPTISGMGQVPVRIPQQGRDWTHGADERRLSDANPKMILDIASIAQHFDEHTPHLLYVDSQSRTIAAEPVHVDRLKNPGTWLRQTLDDLAARAVAIVVPDQATWLATINALKAANLAHYDGPILDVVAKDKQSGVISAQRSGLIWNTQSGDNLVDAWTLFEKRGQNDEIAPAGHVEGKASVSEAGRPDTNKRDTSPAVVREKRTREKGSGEESPGYEVDASSPADEERKTSAEAGIAASATGGQGARRGLGQKAQGTQGSAPAGLRNPTLNRNAGQFARAADDIRRALLPTSRSREAAVTGRIFRANAGRMAREFESARMALKTFAKDLNRLSPTERLEFIDGMENGQPQPSPELTAAAQGLRTLLDDAKKDVQSLGSGKLKQWIENYFPHIWKDPKTATIAIGRILGKRPIEGPKSFLKKRSIPTVKEGMAQGLELVTDNPVDLTLLKIREMKRYVFAHRALNELKAAGLAKFVGARAKAPEGWGKLDDKIGTVFGEPKVTIDESFDSNLRKHLNDLLKRLGGTHQRMVNLDDGPGNAQGLAYRGSLEVKTKFGGDVTVLMHEIGHILDFKYGLWDHLIEPVAKRTATKGKRLGQSVPDMKHASNSPEAKNFRKTIKRELRALADMRYEGSNADDVPKSFKDYVRKKPEQIANALHALMYMPERMGEVAPTIKERLSAFLKQNPTTAEFLNLRKSLVLGAGTAEKEIYGTLIRGYWYLPQEAADVVNNYLAPGLRGKPIYDAYMMVGTTMNSAQLGLSAFHLGFTSMDAIVSKNALAFEQLAAGKPLAAVRSLLEAPITPITNAVRGHRLLKAYLNGDPNLAEMVEAVMQAGGRVKMDDFYKVGAPHAFMEALRARKLGKAAGWLIPAVLEIAAAPILEYVVPRQKLGVFFDLARFEMEKLPAGATQDEVRKVLQKVWDSVDNRMGQLVYDNLFWKRTLKDGLMASVRAVGWNLGTIREVGGGASDWAKLPYRAIRKTRGSDDPLLTHGMAYVVSLVFTTAVAGAIYNYLHTGEPPKDAKDLFLPRTGKTNNEGNPERVELPTYVKDVMAYAHHPGKTILNKLHPLLAVISDMWTNEDYFGHLIRNPHAPLVKQLRQEVDYLADAFVPFGIRNAIEERSRGQSPVVQAENFVGIVPAKRADTRTLAQNYITEYIKRHSAEHMTPEEVEQMDVRRSLRKSLTDGESVSSVVKEARLAGMGASQVRRLVRQRHGGDPMVTKFKMLPFPEATTAWSLASDSEKKAWRRAFLIKRMGYAKEHGRAAVTALMQSQ